MTKGSTMGFGTLFFGYFLLLNISYYGFTDLISALIMAMAFYKLSGINKPFRGAFFISLIFAAVGAFELTVQILAMFNPESNFTPLLSYADISRYAIIAVLTLFMLLGIENVAYEVGLGELAKTARLAMPFSLTLYLILAILGTQSLDIIIPTTVLPWISVFALIGAFLLTLVNLVSIYKAYMKICMPEDNKNGTDRSSRAQTRKQ